jgi:hypothetical protein
MHLLLSNFTQKTQFTQICCTGSYLVCSGSVDGDHDFDPERFVLHIDRVRVKLWSISPTFYECICANILAPKRVKTLKKLNTKLLCEKGPSKMLVKLPPGRTWRGGGRPEKPPKHPPFFEGGQTLPEF